MATPIPTNRAPFRLEGIALATRGTILGGGPRPDELAGVFSDSRAVVPGSVFVALRDEAHDGHAFVGAARDRGAGVLVVERGRLEPSPGASVVEVDDTLVAWGDLARAHLTRWRAARRLSTSSATRGRCGSGTGSMACFRRSCAPRRN